MSRRKQSNPKPLKSGEEESGAEDDKTDTKNTLKDTTISSKNTIPATYPKLKENELSTIIKKESQEFRDDNDQTDALNFDCNSSLERDHKFKTTLENIIKKEPETSSLPSGSTTFDEEDSPATVLNSPSILTETIKYYHAEINSAATDRQYKSETLDTRQGFLCPPCGIRFSSLSTLKAHQTHYCSHRLNRKSKDGAASDGEDGCALFTCGSYIEDEGNGVENMQCSELSTKSAKTGKQYCCSHCSYSADKKVSLNRHMRMHSTSPTPSVQTDLDSLLPSVDRYCQECDIRFSNLKTFKAHKMHYCRTRNVMKRASSGNLSTSSDLLIDSQTIPSLQFDFPKYSETRPFIALPTNPVLIVPYSLIQAGNLLSGPITSALSSQNGVYLVLSDGNIQMVTQGVANENIQTLETNSPVLQPLLLPKNSHVRSHYKMEEKNTSPKDMKTLPAGTLNGALDLRMHHEPGTNKIITHVGASEEEKENCFQDTRTNSEDIVCVPSIPIMISTLSNASTPSLSPSSPSSPSTLKRPDEIISPHSKSVIKTMKKSVMSKVANDFDNKAEESKSLSTQNNAALMPGKMLVMASPVEPRFTSEMAIQPTSSIKTTALNPITNIPLSLPPAISPIQIMAPDLIEPTLLTLLNSELARHLATGGSTSNTPQYLQRGAWKCKSCNIGFCKYKNYVAHKKHYCSSREIRDSTHSPDNSSKTSPIRSISPEVQTLPPAVSQSLAKENSSPELQSQQPSSQPPLSSCTKVIQNNGHRSTFSQFACSLCGIKYSSIDNLTTHQTFYCPNRSTAALGNVVKESDLQCCMKCKEENYIRCSKEDPVNEVSAVDNSSKTIRKKLLHEKIERESLSENKASPASLLLMASTVLEKNSSPMKVEEEEEDEYIEIDELPIVQTELMKNNERSTVIVSEENTPTVDSKVASDLEYRSSQQDNKKDDSKYCKSCNISFRYLPTYLAHKKFYCSNQSSNGIGTVTSFNNDESCIVVSSSIATAAHTV